MSVCAVHFAEGSGRASDHKEEPVKLEHENKGAAGAAFHWDGAGHGQDGDVGVAGVPPVQVGEDGHAAHGERENHH